ncbi:MAG: hypothetical protein LBU85_01055 [Treponema sp.]|jgi:hypothetical protein|nr:hypothetical protein [Treponema sp.]
MEYGEIGLLSFVHQSPLADKSACGASLNPIYLKEGENYFMLEKEFQFYETNKTAIREKYLGKQIVIVGDQIIASYDDVDEAYQETIKAYTPGTFMIHDVPINIEDEIVHLSPFGF